MLTPQFAPARNPKLTERPWNHRANYCPWCPFMSNCGVSWSLTRYPSKSLRPAPRRRATVRLVDGLKCRGVYFNDTMDGEPPYFYFTINPRLGRLSLPLTLWQEIPADRVPALDQEKGNYYPRPGCERECLASLFHSGLAES